MLYPLSYEGASAQLTCQPVPTADREYQRVPTGAAGRVADQPSTHGAHRAAVDRHSDNGCQPVPATANRCQRLTEHSPSTPQDPLTDSDCHQTLAHRPGVRLDLSPDLTVLDSTRSGRPGCRWSDGVPAGPGAPRAVSITKVGQMQFHPSPTRDPFAQPLGVGDDAPEALGGGAQPLLAHLTQPPGPRLRTRPEGLRSIDPLVRDQHHGPTSRPPATRHPTNPPNVQHARVTAPSNTHRERAALSRFERRRPAPRFPVVQEQIRVTHSGVLQ
jgi:hypothetical protein